MNNIFSLNLSRWRGGEAFSNFPRPFFQGIRRAVMVAWLCLTLLFGTAQAAVYYVDPAAGSDTGNGSGTAPWKTLEKVASDGKLSKLKGGDTVLLRSGNHGDVTISGDNESPVTLAAAPGQTPQLSHLQMNKGSKWVVKGLTISPSFAAAPYKGDIVSLAENKDVTLEDCFVYTVLDSSKWDKKEWMETYNGIRVAPNSAHITLRNNYVLNTRMAVILASPNSLFEGNVIANFSGDGLRICNNGITAQYNVIKSAYVSMDAGDPNHDDLIQGFTQGGKGEMRDDTVRNNILIAQEDPQQPWPTPTCHGIGFFDGPVINCIMEKNVISTSAFDGVTLADAQNCQILDNVCFSTITDPKNPDRKPSIKFGAKLKQNKGNTVKDNYAYLFNLKLDPAVVEANNKTVTKEIYEKRLKELEDSINDKFGKFHPVAKFARLGKEKGEYVPPSKPLNGK